MCTCVHVVLVLCVILSCRYNDLFGTQAPSRISFQSRSSSDPNIRLRLFNEDVELDIHEQEEGRGDEGETPNETKTEEEADAHLTRPVSAGTNSNKASPLQIPLVLESRVHQSLPPEKAEGMIDFIVSLEPHNQLEDERDLGINDPSSSESESLFSSPPFTPPNEDAITFQRKKAELGNASDPPGGPGSNSRLTLSPNDPAHSRVARATSLPSSIRPSSASERSYPCNQLSPAKKSPSSCHTGDGRDDELNEEGAVVGGVRDEVGGASEKDERERINPTLITSVTNRIKEIENMNSRAEGSGRRGNLSHASSEDSLSVKDVPETTPSPMQTEQPDDACPASSPAGVGSTTPTGEDEKSVEERDKRRRSSNRSPACDSPSTRYRKATEAASILEKRRSEKQGTIIDNNTLISSDIPQVEDIATEEGEGDSGKGVKELLGVFDRQPATTGGRRGSDLKRTSSLRGTADAGNVMAHKRGASIGDI